MKFLCVACDEGMKLHEISGPDEDGSLAAVYSCPKCASKFAMLTNAHETQMVSSLGVKIGAGGKEEKASKCPFTGVVRQAVNEKGLGEKNHQTQSSSVTMPWSQGAQERLMKIPEFVRPAAQLSIETFAAQNGIKEITEEVLEQAKNQWSN